MSGVTYSIPEYNTAYDCEGDTDPTEDYFVRK